MIENSEVIVRIFLSIILSGLIGLERKMYNKPAGLRTNIMVGLGATILMILGLYILSNYNEAGNVDISRIVGQVVTGIGFLGAGAIIQSRGSVHGLTTAASIWVVAAIGMAVGLGYYFMAVSATLASLVVLVIVGRIEYRFERHNNEKEQVQDKNSL
jgi:putative Mg2+ transporter-C (MgtC) family protein